MNAKAQDVWIPNGCEIMPQNGAPDGPSTHRIMLDCDFVKPPEDRLPRLISRGPIEARGHDLYTTQ